jgi:hypothetical protein
MWAWIKKTYLQARFRDAVRFERVRAEYLLMFDTDMSDDIAMMFAGRSPSECDRITSGVMTHFDPNTTSPNTTIHAGEGMSDPTWAWMIHQSISGQLPEEPDE